MTLGDKETGGKDALPIWLDVMKQYYKDKPIEEFQVAVPVTTLTPEIAPPASSPADVAVTGTAPPEVKIN